MFCQAGNAQDAHDHNPQGCHVRDEQVHAHSFMVSASGNRAAISRDTALSSKTAAKDEPPIVTVMFMLLSFAVTAANPSASRAMSEKIFFIMLFHILDELRRGSAYNRLWRNIVRDHRARSPSTLHTPCRAEAF